MFLAGNGCCDGIGTGFNASAVRRHYGEPAVCPVHLDLVIAPLPETAAQNPVTRVFIHKLRKLRPFSCPLNPACDTSAMADTSIHQS
jgi:hypothetical protein